MCYYTVEDASFVALRLIFGKRFCGSNDEGRAIIGVWTRGVDSPDTAGRNNAPKTATRDQSDCRTLAERWWGLTSRILHRFLIEFNGSESIWF